MNNSSVDTAHLIEMINNEKSKVLMPATAYLTVLMVTGLVGNLMVCFFYGFKTRTSPTSVFIVTLATYDLISCTISMPTEIVHIVHFYTFQIGASCKIIRFISYFATIASVLTLVAIAIDRYSLINKARGKQMTLQRAKVYCAVVPAVAILLSWPALFVYSFESVYVPNTHGLNLKGYDCTFPKASSFKLYLLLFHTAHGLLIVVFTFALTVLYSKVVCVIYKHRKRLAGHRYEMPRCTQTKISAPTLSDIESQNPGDTETKGTDSNLDESGESEESPASEMKHITNERNDEMKNTTQKVKQTTVDTEHTETIRVTMVMLSVTILFVVSFIPYGAAIIWRSIIGKHEGEYSDTQLLLFTLCSRSVFINSGFNPLIYGIFNRKFRQYYYNVLCIRIK